MPRSWAGAGLAGLQAAVYAFAAVELTARSPTDAWLLGAAGVAQLGALVARLAGRRRLLAGAAGLTLLLAAVVWGRFFLLAMHVRAVFGPEVGAEVFSALAGTLVAVPWLLAVPVTQLVAAGAGRAGLLVLLAPLPGLATPALDPRPDGALALATATAIRAAWSSGAPLATEALPDAPFVVTFLHDGEPLATPLRVDPPRGFEALAAAVNDARAEGSPAAADAVVVDIVVGEVPAGLVRPAVDAPAGTSPRALATSLRRTRRLPFVGLPSVAGDALRYASAVAGENGGTPLSAGWAPPPELDVATIQAAIRAGAHHLATNQGPGGQFTYIVRGPSGLPGPGYNYPRHAGTAWFLARAAAALDDPLAADAADRALDHLEARSGQTADGRWYIQDPSRRDGRSWIGSVALATLAQVTRLTTPGPLPAPPAGPRLEGWVRSLAASVDDAGMVRPEVDRDDGSFPTMPANAYGQGQTLVALAAVVRAGPRLTELTPATRDAARGALDRALAWLDHDAYGTAHPLYVPDEHWMCLAATAAAEARGARSVGADGVCATYVDQVRRETAPGSAGPPAGPAGGAAEAVVARAWDFPTPTLLAAASAYGRLFLAAQYQPADLPLLGRGDRLVGGFRDGPGALDVQIDAVQHIGGALLGLEALLTGHAAPGALP